MYSLVCFCHNLVLAVSGPVSRVNLAAVSVACSQYMFNYMYGINNMSKRNTRFKQHDTSLSGNTISYKDMTLAS